MLRVHRLAKGLAILLQQRGVSGPAELVERAALGRFTGQANLIRLPVDRDHRPDDLGQRGGGNGPRPQVRARSAGSADGAADDEFAPLDDATGLLTREATSSPTEKMPSTESRSAPLRTSAASALAPSRSCRLDRTIVLPAPVSPVTTIRPPPKSTCADAMTPRLAISRDSITGSHPSTRARED